MFCREHFTVGQGDRFRYFLRTSNILKPVLTSVKSLLSPQKNTISRTIYMSYPGMGEICDEGQHKLQFQKGFAYTIKYGGNLFDKAVSFSPVQLPIIHIRTKVSEILIP